MPNVPAVPGKVVMRRGSRIRSGSICQTLGEGVDEVARIWPLARTARFSTKFPGRWAIIRAGERLEVQTLKEDSKSRRTWNPRKGLIVAIFCMIAGFFLVKRKEKDLIILVGSKSCAGGRIYGKNRSVFGNSLPLYRIHLCI